MRGLRLVGTAAVLAVLSACSVASTASTQGEAASTPGKGGAVAVPAATSPHAHTAPTSPSAPLRVGERFSTLTVPRAYAPRPPSGGTDEYRCFLVDPGLTRPAFLTGSQFLPQNAAIVHHAIFFRIYPAQAEAARESDARSPGEGWTCFGNAGISGDAAWVAHWAPGVGETLLAPDIGYPMPPGSLLVMQVHYNLLGRAGAGASDRSGIRLRLTDRGDLKPLETMLLPAPVELPCGAGEAGPLCNRAAAVRDVARRFGDQSAAMADRLNAACRRGRVAGAEQHCDHPVWAAGTVRAVAGHMHMLGRSITVQLNPGGRGERTLLDVPAYNFDEQAVVPLPEPVAVKPGDTLRVTCRHDVTLRQRLPQLRTLPPRYVVWGEGTSDEMCLGLVVWSRTP
jgi:Copper type II ascorbate-dependent monooxygenase, C-terminal domain